MPQNTFRWRWLPIEYFCTPPSLVIGYARKTKHFIFLNTIKGNDISFCLITIYFIKKTRMVDDRIWNRVIYRRLILYFLTQWRLTKKNSTTTYFISWSLFILWKRFLWFLQFLSKFTWTITRTMKQYEIKTIT